MIADLSLVADWETLERGEPEERACFAAIGLEHKLHRRSVWLTEAEDSFAKSVRSKPFLSGYRLAEWIAWNWWRLRWEPKTNAADWLFAHQMSSIGFGYVWPNITIFSDGERIAFVAQPTLGRPEEPLRYLTSHAAVITADQFEALIDRFLEQIQTRLQFHGLDKSNFSAIWREVLAERQDPRHADRRRFEALLGADPDEADPEAIDQLLADAKIMGLQPMAEIAAQHWHDSSLLTARALRELADATGFDGRAADIVQLSNRHDVPTTKQAQAWLVGREAAQLLRQQEGMGGACVPDRILAALAGTREANLDGTPNSFPMSFTLRTSGSKTRTVLRSRWRTGRRFELARLIGDTILNVSTALYPATRSYTYRQKVQRSFAAEFLAPFNETYERLGRDYSTESMEEVAHYFQVSPMTIQTLLVNHHVLERDDLEQDFDIGSAA